MLWRSLFALAVALPATLCVGAAAAREDEGELVNAIVAIVNNEAVTKLEADALAAEFLREAPNPTREEYRKAWEKAREFLIDERVLIQEARRRKIEVEPEEVNREIKRLEQAGVDTEGRRDMIRERLTVSRLLERLYTPRAVSPREVTDYYKKHPEEFVLRERRHIFLIAVYARKLGGDKAAAKKRAKEVLQRLKKGEDFAVLAKKFSHGPAADKGGDQGWMSRGTLLKALDAAAWRLKPGEFSDLIEAHDGYCIVRVAGVQPASRQSLADARPEILRRLQAKHRQAQREQFIERLRRGASIIRIDLYRKAEAKP